MKIFHCTHCDYPVYFENVTCSNCQYWLGYSAKANRMQALSPGGLAWTASGAPGNELAYCGNHAYRACNWLIPASDARGLCLACELNQTIPNLDDPEHLREWQALELAKHRLVYALLRLGLPIENKLQAPDRGLAFNFLADEPGSNERVMTGHDEGLITLNVEEADSVTREANRVKLHEKYRTLIGHFRHEVGHYYWDRLVFTQPELLDDFRKLFGDERADYGQSLQEHYKNGAPPDWQASYISEYATSHPWEDWAETWAHYLHLMDMLETAHAFGLAVQPASFPDQLMDARADFDPYVERDMERILSTCVPVTFALNSLNRGMGRDDLYPFVINGGVRAKLTFVNRVVVAGSSRG